MKSLYDQNPEVWGELASKGRGCLASMAKKFVKCADMDRALGFKNATSRWQGGRGFLAYGAENRAEHWLGGIHFDWNHDGSQDAIKVSPPDGVICEPATCVLSLEEDTVGVLYLYGWEGM